MKQALLSLLIITTTLFIITLNASSFTAVPIGGPKSCNPQQSWECIGYWVYLPDAYNDSSIEALPTIITLHGLGEQGKIFLHLLRSMKI